MPGRKPKPTATKLLDGNPGNRAINRNEPKFTGTPSCPKHLDKVARAEWKRLANELASQGLLTTVDRSALAGYCTSWSHWAAAEESIQKYGLVIKSPKSGYPIQNPYVGIANTALDQMRKFAVEFGMTPSSRARITVADTGAGAAEAALETFMSATDKNHVTKKVTNEDEPAIQ